MVSITIGIIVLVWSFWAGFALYYTNKLLRVNLKYLFEPNIDLFSTTNAGARYDQFRIRRWEIYLGSIFLLPLRVLAALILVPTAYIILRVVYILFCGKNPRLNQ